ncbi:MAG: NAD(P)H-dependent oxidoreductase [Methanomicrobiales archaeon]|nr:NAD(P)H-dependent oxidoreductase [Methanomicrobiales archaeon]
MNGSSHRSNSNRYMLDLVGEALMGRNVSYQRYNLNEFHINHSWCCYSMRDHACKYPCRDPLDDMLAFHEMIIASKAVVVGSPVNWNNMSARLK